MKWRLIWILAGVSTALLASLIVYLKTDTAERSPTPPAVSDMPRTAAEVQVINDPLVPLTIHELTGQWQGSTKSRDTSIDMLLKFSGSDRISETDQMWYGMRYRGPGRSFAKTAQCRMADHLPSKTIHIISDSIDVATDKLHSDTIGEIHRTESGKTYVTFLPPIPPQSHAAVPKLLLTKVK